MFRHALICIFIIFQVGCAYKFGYRTRKLPGGYQKLSIPVFSNKSQTVSTEAYFTNALIREFERSRVVKIAKKNIAPVYIEGIITSIEVLPNGQIAANVRSASLKYLPLNTVINTGYRIRVNVTLKLVRQSDKGIIWKNSFVNERVYSAPQVSLPGVNSVNPLYNYSAKHQTIELLAADMMREAHDRMTERF